MPGANTVTLEATDLAGNRATTSLSLTYLRLPRVTITAPAPLSYTNITPTTVSGTVDDPSATIAVNGIATANAGGSFSLALPLAEGPNPITVTATAVTGAVGTSSLEVTLDTTPPHVTITAPMDRFVTTDASIAVAGIINDIVVGTVNDQQAQVTINGTAAQVANRSFLATNIPLALGTNILQAFARDRVGNLAATSVTVIRQPPSQAQIQLISGNNQSAVIGTAVAAPLVVSVTDASGPVANQSVVFKVKQNDGLLAVAGAPPAATVIALTNAQGRAQVTWTLGHRAGAGGNVVEAYAVSYDGTALFTASATQSGPAMIVVDSGGDQLGAIGEMLPKPFIAVAIDQGHNRIAGVPVTFTVQQGGGSLNGGTTLTVMTDSDGRAAATLTLGLQEGHANNIVDANFSGNSGFPAAFTASGRAPGNPAQTTVSGVVLDNTNQPIRGVTVRAILATTLHATPGAVAVAPSAVTDAQGQFTIAQAPIGATKILVDGATAQRPGVYPSLEYDLVTVTGQSNTVGQPMYLLPLDTSHQLCVTASTGGGTLTLPESPGFSLTFSPGQVTFPGGSKSGCVSVTVVHGDKVPMVPGFGQQPQFIVTIQPAGAVFNPPAAITLPNVDGLKPREVTEMYSFDHDIGSFVAIGTGIVSDDGQIIRSSPGVGVLKAGWHCGGNSAPTGTAATCPVCRFCANATCLPDLDQDGRACVTGTITGICHFGNCQAPHLQVLRPTDSDTFWIDESPAMEPVEAQAKITGVTPDPTTTTLFRWDIQIHYQGPAPDNRIVDLPALPGYPTNLLGGAFTPDFQGQLRGGDATVLVTADVLGAHLSDTQQFKIRGRNPSPQAVIGYLNSHFPGTVLPADKIACWESEHTLGQFNSQNLPRFGKPNGYGIMQVDNPRASDNAVWNWRTNLDEGLSILAEKWNIAQGWPASVKQTYPTATDYVTLGLVDDVTGLPYVVLDAIKQYNGFHYWSWDDTQKRWLRTEPYSPSVPLEKKPHYVYEVLNAHCQ